MMAAVRRDATIQVTYDGGRAPLWAADMTEIYYRRGSSVVAVRIEVQGGFRVREREVLFDGPYMAESLGPSYDVHPSGEPFLMTKLGAWSGRMVLDAGQALYIANSRQDATRLSSSKSAPTTIIIERRQRSSRLRKYLY